MFALNKLYLLSPEFILLVAAFFVLALDLFGKRRWQKSLPYWTLGGLALAMIASFWLLGHKEAVFGTMAADSFAYFFQLVGEVVMFMVVLAAMDYFPGRTRALGELYALLLSVTLAIVVAVSAIDLIMVYLGMEFLSITSYVLAGFVRENKRSNEAGIKYFLYGSIASAVMLYGMSLLYGLAGTTDLAVIAKTLAAGKSFPGYHWLLFPALLFLTVGFGYKASLVPFHQWAPDVYDGAPTPVSAFLSTASKAVGFALMIRVFLIALPSIQVDWVALLYALSVLTMTVGNFVALRQTSVKRLLAYSSVAQAGYIVMGLVAFNGGIRFASFDGVSGVLFYLLAYAFTNAGAFIAVAALEEHLGSSAFEDYDGLSKRSPFLAAIFFIILLSLGGVPATGGFVGKLLVFGAAIANQFYILAAIAVVNAVVAMGYYLRIVKHMFFVPATEDAEAVPVAMPTRVALIISLVGILLLGIFPGWFMHLATASGLAMVGL